MTVTLFEDDDTAKEISDAERRAFALRDIAGAQAKAGDVKGALVTVKETGISGEARAWALADIYANWPE